MISPTIYVHCVTKTVLSRVSKQDTQHESYTRDIVLETEEGRALRLTLFAASPEALEAVVQIAPKP